MHRYPFCSALVVTTASLAFTGSLSHAGVIGVGVSGSEITSIEVEANDELSTTTYAAGDLVLGTLTSVSTDTSLFLPWNTSVPADVSGVIDNDLTIDNGLGNPSSISFTFDTPILNLANSDDFFLADFGGSNDAHEISINGQTVTISGGTQDFATPSNVDIAILNDTPASTDPDDLDGLAWSVSGRSQAPINFNAYDLSDFGIAEGDSAVSMTVTSADGLDPMVIGGFQAIPEPSSAALVLLGLGLVGVSGRRR